MADPATASNGKPAALVTEALLVSASEAARLAGVSKPSWWRLHSGGLVPEPIRLGGRTLWRVDELRRWVAAGCPDRAAWERLEAVRRGR